MPVLVFYSFVTDFTPQLLLIYRKFFASCSCRSNSVRISPTALIFQCEIQRILALFAPKSLVRKRFSGCRRNRKTQRRTRAHHNHRRFIKDKEFYFVNQPELHSFINLIQVRNSQFLSETQSKILIKNQSKKSKPKIKENP